MTQPSPSAPKPPAPPAPRPPAPPATAARSIARPGVPAAAAPVQKQRSERMRPASAQPTMEQRGNRVLVYGPPGIGKSTLASKFPDPIFMAFDDGQFKLKAMKFPVKPETFAEVLDAIHFLEVDEHSYQTLVFDLLEGVEPLIHKQVVAERVNSRGSKVRSIDEFGFMEGYSMAVDYWRTFTTALERLQRARPKTEIIMLCHEVTRSVKNPNGEDYMRAEPNLNRKAVDYLYGWTDYVLQARQQVYTTTVDPKGFNRNRIKGWSDGARLLMSDGQPAFVAKRRTVLPEPLELDGEVLYELLTSTASMVEPLIAEINVLLALVDADTAARVSASLQRASDDTNELTRIHGKLAAIVAMNTPAEAGATETTEQGETA